MTSSGLFIVIEGPEGSGKSTLTRAMAERMRRAGIDPIMVREPGGTRTAEIVRAALLDPQHAVTPLAELFLYLAARADLVETVIRPALDAGSVVLSDRFALSTQAYQMAGRGLSADIVDPANRAATAGLTPHLTLVLDLPPDVGRARQEAVGKLFDRLEGEGGEFHWRVGEHYRAARGPGICHIDAAVPADTVLEAAWSALVEAAPDRFPRTT